MRSGNTVIPRMVLAVLTLLTVGATLTPPRAAGASGAARGAVVRTADGPVAGIVAYGHRAFRGIPYAAPPVGPLRWGAPQPPEAWSEVRDATRSGSPCPQLPSVLPGDSAKGSTTEDCLYLDVYTPRPAGRRHPVMVWLHGGAFLSGAGSDYDGSELAERTGAVVVTVNYRLGVFGFLRTPGSSTEDDNAGIRDQQAALRWVRRNAAAFGGDPSRVTIFGESAGAASVCAHLVSPTAAGLFHRAVVQSGPCVTPVRTAAAAEQQGAALATTLGCTDPVTRPACLRALPVPALLAAAGTELGSFGPYVDGAVLPEQPATAIAAGRLHRVPVLLGSTHDEYRLFVALLYDLAGDPVTAARYPEIIRQQFGDRADAVLARYPADRYASPGIALATVITDARFACPTRRTAALLSARVPTYAYEFADPAAPEFIVTDPLMPLGAFHAAELPYLFGTGPGADQLTPQQRTLSTRVMDYWGRFAATGAPTTTTAPAWPHYGPRRDVVQSLVPLAVGPVRTFAVDHQCEFWEPAG
ncbi:carboxylesterase/lipase family protein [Actinoplanes sp. NPDC049681]|uniref:carboxylesterase/lipase family protein n=1 Tax=Actinoplanes sp. NPDC049681 TaxID=3363905 RepID=UPI003798F51F